MQISGLILTCSAPGAFATAGVPLIREAGPFTVGEWNGSHLSLALEAQTPQESERWHDWLRRLPGVLQVEVVFVSYEEEAFHE